MFNILLKSRIIKRLKDLIFRIMNIFGKIAVAAVSVVTVSTIGYFGKKMYDKKKSNSKKEDKKSPTEEKK